MGSLISRIYSLCLMQDHASKNFEGSMPGMAMILCDTGNARMEWDKRSQSEVAGKSR